MAGGRLAKLLTSGVSIFVVVNVLANLLFIVRSYLSMRVLDHEQLGVVALLQTLILLISTLQFGIVNGGYRLLCSEGEAESTRINDLVFTFTGALGLGCTAILLCALPFLESGRIVLTGALGVAAGVATLLRNWLANHLIAKVKLKRFNSVTVWCAIISMVPLVLTYRASAGLSRFGGAAAARLHRDRVVGRARAAPTQAGMAEGSVGAGDDGRFCRLPDCPIRADQSAD